MGMPIFEGKVWISRSGQNKKKITNSRGHDINDWKLRRST